MLKYNLVNVYIINIIYEKRLENKIKVVYQWWLKLGLSTRVPSVHPV